MQKTQDPPNSPKQTRLRILEEAEKLFAERDYAGTGMEKIARRVGIAKSVIYHHFKNKDEILQTLIDDFFDAAAELNRRLPAKYGVSCKRPGETSPEIVENLMREFVDFLAPRKWMLRIVLLESIKESNDIPLFAIVRKFQTVSEECCGIVTETLNERLADVRVADFFMNFLPVFAFLVFQDKWSERQGLDPDSVQKSFIDTYVRYTREVYWPLCTQTQSSCLAPEGGPS